MTRHDGMDPSVGIAPCEAGQAAWACYEGIGRKRARGVLACSRIDDRYHGSSEDPMRIRFPQGGCPEKVKTRQAPTSLNDRQAHLGLMLAGVGSG